MIKKRSFLFMLLCIVCMLSAKPMATQAAYVTASGQAGDDAVWELDNEGTLTFSGSGALYGAGITSGYSPWGKFSDYEVKKVVVKEGITSLGEHDTFSQCPYLEKVILPDSLEGICSAAFKSCPLLKNIKMGKNLKYINSEAFRGDYALEEIDLPKGLTSIGAGAFSGTGIKNIVIPASFDGDLASTAGDNCGVFSSCSQLESIVILGNVHYIGNFFVSRCYNLRYIVFSGDAPTFDIQTMGNAPACIGIYPADNKTWIGNMPSNGSVRWIPSSLDTRKIKSATSVAGGIKLTWDSFPEVCGYKIYRKYSGGSWKKIKTISDAEKTSYTDKTVDSGVTVQYKVCPYVSVPGASFENKNSPAKTAVYLGSPSISSVKNTVSGLKVSWTKDSSVDGYCIYRKKGFDEWKQIKTIEKNSTKSYEDTKATSNGTKYSYRIYTYKTVSGKTYKGAASPSVSLFRLKRPEIAAITNSAAGKMKITWNKNASASGYQVQYSTSSDFSSVKSFSISEKTTVSKTCSKLNKNKKYYVRVRSYKTVSSKKQYSAWSKTSSITIKK